MTVKSERARERQRESVCKSERKCKGCMNVNVSVCEDARVKV